MADASKTGFRVYEDRIPVSHETNEICRFFEIDPLSLISSGALLIVAVPEKTEGIVRLLKEKGIEASIIGDILADSKRRTIVRRSGAEEELPLPLSDELWKALARKM